MRFIVARILAVAAALFILPNSRAEAPKLVLTIIVDQMRYDYLERAPERLVPNGFRLLLERGAFMTSAKYNYYPTLTGPGHAAYLSGSGPAVNGILANEWFDKKTGKIINCVSDPDTNIVAIGTTNKIQVSPRNFIGATVADQMRLHFDSKVVAVSIKDRGAILPAGKKPAGAYWFDNKSGNFVTTSYYRTNLPPWVSAFNERKIAQGYVGQKWERLLDASEYTFPDAGPAEGKVAGETNNSVFPHFIYPSTNLEAIVETPFGDEMLTEFAIAALDGEELGRTNRTDLFCMSYSSPDLAGHQFGPYSQETQDQYARLDRQLEKLFNHIDETIGLGNVFILLTADHGVAPIPEFAAGQGLDGHRWNSTNYMDNLQKVVEKQFGAGAYFRTNKLSHGDIYFDHKTLREKNLAPAIFAEFLREHLLSDGLFQACFTRQQLLNGQAPGWIGQAVINGYNAERGADLIMVGKPFGIGGKEISGTSHSTPYSYDTRVPVIFFGRPFKAGRYADEFFITDIAPTLCSALRIVEPPGSIGKVALHILADQ